MFLQGYGPLILAGTWQTVKLAVLSLVLSFLLGLLGAGAKLSRNRVTNGIGTLYTTLIRGVPDLVLMLLLFYSLQIWLNQRHRPAGLGPDRHRPVRRRRAGARLHLRRLLHRNLPRRLPGGAARPARSRRPPTA